MTEPLYTNKERLSLKELNAEVKKLYLYLKTRRFFIATLVVTGIAAGVAYAYVKKPTYTATITFVLENHGSESQLSQYAGLASMVGVDIGGGKSGLFQNDNIIELYQSDRMVRKTLLSSFLDGTQKRLLVDQYIGFKGLKEKWEKSSLNPVSFSADTQTTGRLQDSLLGVFTQDIKKNYLRVGKFNDNSSIIKVEVRSENEIFSKEFANNIVNNVNLFYTQTKTKAAAENLRILQFQTDSVRNALNTSIMNTAAVNDATPNLNPTRLILRAPAQRSQINSEANKAMLSELIKNLELAKISMRKEAPLIQLVDSPVYPLPKKETKLFFAAVCGLLGGFLFAVAYLSLKKVMDEL